MNKFKKSDWIAIVVFLVIIQIISLWCIDISISAMNIKEYSDERGLEELKNISLTNGFFKHNPIVAYHISLFLLIISFFIMALISIHQINDY